jgi:hypothetical protein
LPNDYRWKERGFACGSTVGVFAVFDGTNLERTGRMFGEEESVIADS